MTRAHALVLADILGKSVALAYYEKEIASVFDTIEPAASRLATAGQHSQRAARHCCKLVGSALLAQHRVSGRIAFAEKPDILWEHPELERFYARLEDEYEIVERGTSLNGKMSVIATRGPDLHRHDGHGALGAAGTSDRDPDSGGTGDRGGDLVSPW